MPPPSPGELKTVIGTLWKRLGPPADKFLHTLNEQKVQNFRRWLKDDLEPTMMIKDGLGPCNCTCIYLSDSGTEDGEGGGGGACALGPSCHGTWPRHGIRPVDYKLPCQPDTHTHPSHTQSAPVGVKYMPRPPPVQYTDTNKTLRRQNGHFIIPVDGFC